MGFKEQFWNEMNWRWKNDKPGYLLYCFLGSMLVFIPIMLIDVYIVGNTEGKGCLMLLVGLIIVAFVFTGYTRTETMKNIRRKEEQEAYENAPICPCCSQKIIGGR